MDRGEELPYLAEAITYYHHNKDALEGRIRPQQREDDGETGSHKAQGNPSGYAADQGQYGDEQYSRYAGLAELQTHHIHKVGAVGQGHAYKAAVYGDHNHNQHHAPCILGQQKALPGVLSQRFPYLGCDYGRKYAYDERQVLGYPLEIREKPGKEEGAADYDYNRKEISPYRLFSPRHMRGAGQVQPFQYAHISGKDMNKCHGDIGQEHLVEFKPCYLQRHYYTGVEGEPVLPHMSEPVVYTGL